MSEENINELEKSVAIYLDEQENYCGGIAT